MGEIEEEVGVGADVLSGGGGWGLFGGLGTRGGQRFGEVEVQVDGLGHDEEE